MQPNISFPWRACLAGVMGALLCASTAFGAAEAKPETKADAKADAKAADKPGQTSTNKAWEVKIPESVFVDDRNKKELKDPFFPSSERRLSDAELAKRAKEKADKEAAAAAAAAAAAGTQTNAPGTKPTVQAPAKWYSGFSVRGRLGPTIQIHTGTMAYTFREGQTREVKTPKGPVRVTCVKVTDDSVELRMEGENEPGKLPLP